MADEIRASSLSSQIYAHLKGHLMSARLQPGERIKIRALAQSLGTSETPVREALFQLVKDGALEMKTGQYIRVRQLSLREYIELRDIRLELEPYAASRAMPLVDDALLQKLRRLHEGLVDAERDQDYPAALQYNYDFHFSLYRRSDMRQLTEILERLWVQVGPLLNLLYPHGHPTYANGHQHLNILAALEASDEERLRKAVRDDMLEGGKRFLDYLESLDKEGRL